MTPQQSNTNAHTQTHTLGSLSLLGSGWHSYCMTVLWILYQFSAVCVFIVWSRTDSYHCVHEHTRRGHSSPAFNNRTSRLQSITSELCSSSCVLPHGGNGSRCPGWLCLLISEFCVWEQSTIFRRTENNTVFHGAETQCQEGCFSGNWSMCSSGCLERQQSTGRLGSSESVGELDSRVWHSQYRFSPHRAFVRKCVCASMWECAPEPRKLLSLTYTGFYLLNPPDF